MAKAAEAPVTTAIEGWYRTTPVPPPGPIGIVLVNPYPAETLHVGITGGVEDARTYISLDLGAISSDKEISGGTLTLPINMNNGEGSVRPETATMIACFAQDAGVETEGSPNTPPPVDCSISAPATYVATPTPRFTVNLASFASTIGPFGSGLRSGGVALMPNNAARSSAATWHVAFFAKNNTTQGAQKISATIIYEDPTETSSDSDFDFDFGIEESFTDDFGSSSSDLSSSLSFASPPDDAQPPVANSQPVVRTQAEFDESGPAYLSWVLLVPIALLAFIGYFGKALTFDEETLEEAAI
jgi:hypothetical protein